MIGGLGIDSVEISRMDSVIRRWGDRFLNRVFSSGEIDYCRSRAAAFQHYGARFAAKEACMKCLGRGIWGGLPFRDIETVRNDEGAVGLVLHGRARDLLEQSGGGVFHVSLTHTASTATAVVLLEKRG